ncbi:MAG: hypothetical protein LQ348_003115 [Seirophora lacunosa]|nr:MAG: hypothetical protein LQ348_003115 [Seirophora lacunosa]
MPGEHAVDRAAVQFCGVGLNGTTEDIDVDDNREEPETRAQPPQPSSIAPKATPNAALPPAGESAQSKSNESQGYTPAGAMDLNGTTEDLDVDDDREEPESRAQPPQPSPIAPNAALKPPGQNAQSQSNESQGTPQIAIGASPPEE